MKYLPSIVAVLLLAIITPSVLSQTTSPISAADCDSTEEHFCAFECMAYTDSANPELCAAQVPKDDEDVTTTFVGEVVCRSGKTEWDGEDTTNEYTLGCITRSEDSNQFSNYTEANVPGIGTPKPTKAPGASPSSEGDNDSAVTNESGSVVFFTTWSAFGSLFSLFLGAFVL
jgi:hypothetical protein